MNVKKQSLGVYVAVAIQLGVVLGNKKIYKAEKAEFLKNLGELKELEEE